MVGRVGPAFSLDEVPSAHEVLDRAGAPRRLRGETLTLPERISYLAGMLATARMAASHKKIIVIVSKGENVFTPGVYPESEVKS